MENRRIRFIKNKKKAMAHIRKLKEGSSKKRSADKIRLNLLCRSKCK